ncbi:Probable licABCH operon regulator [Listeria grayi]|uniref:BglG family transcription antiterminator n=1 Tax=Listeria grayi TaxID=1641 RepID=UPI000F6ECC71|nr:BglG family transcription antiterminator [Listeria grayi]VEI31341.1 Probable licABCH operon regulator [Listeria grayi]
MLNEKQKDLLTFLEKHKDSWITSKELAAYCECTTRTIRNRVASINAELPGKITASTYGYRLNTEIKAIGEQPLRNDRKSRILLELLKKSADGIDIYELADNLFISESTLKADIQQMKKEFTAKNIQIIFEKDTVKLVGTERAKRRYMISLLYDESNLQEKLKASIQQMIGYISLAALQEMIRTVFAGHEIRINQYTLNNIVLHYAISIERIRQGHIIKKQTDNQDFQTKREYELAKEIADKLAEEYAIDFSEGELEQLALLFIGIQNETSANSKNKQLKEVVDEKIITALHDVLKQVKKTYLIELGDDQEFFNKLAIHVQSLYHRSKYDTFARNSSLLDLKTAYPLIYDISVYISSLIQEKLAIWFNEDEISFIALHIGSFLGTQKNSIEQASLLLVANDYHDLSENIVAKLENAFGEQIFIKTANEAAIKAQSYDMLLTTDHSIAERYERAIFIQPLLHQNDLRKIEKRIYQIKEQKQKVKMHQYIDQFIPAELYFNQVDLAAATPKAIRKQINQRLLHNGYVGEDFLQSVEKRESMSSTGFPSGIAIPHAIEISAVKSSVAVMTLQEPVMWEAYPVKLIAFVTISKDESKVFNDFFERFIEIVSDAVNTKQLSTSSSYAEFIGRLKGMVDADE